MKNSDKIKWKKIWKCSDLDSSVGIRFQYLRSSLPVIANPFEAIDKQALPVLLSSHTFCNKTAIYNRITKLIQSISNSFPPIYNWICQTLFTKILSTNHPTYTKLHKPFCFFHFFNFRKKLKINYLIIPIKSIKSTEPRIYISFTQIIRKFIKGSLYKRIIIGGQFRFPNKICRRGAAKSPIKKRESTDLRWVHVLEK